MGIETAILGSAIIGGGLSYASSKSASKSAANASQQATDATLQAQREAMATQQANTAVARGAGDASINQLMQRLGLSSGQGQPIAGSPLFSAASTVQGQQPDWNAVLAERPDVAAAVNNPNGGFNGGTVQERVADWYNRYGKDSGYQLPTASATPAQQNGLQLSQSAQVPTYTRPDALRAPAAFTPQTFTPQTYTPQVYNPQTYTAPTYERPEYTDTLDVGYEDYLNSPEAMAAQYDTDRQSGATASALAAAGGLKSGAALKRLQQIGQDNKVKYYSDFRNYETNQYNTDRARTDALFNFDTQLNAQIKQAYDQLNSGNALAYANLNSGNANTAAGLNSQNAYNAASLNSQNALAGANLARSDYQYAQGRQDQNFNTDRAYGTDLALNNRQYETNRYDTATNNLFNLAGIGQGAAQNYNNALQQSANASSNALFSNAANQGNAALSSANMFNNLIGQGINALGTYYGNKGGASGGSTGGAASNPYASLGLFT